MKGRKTDWDDLFWGGGTGEGASGKKIRKKEIRGKEIRKKEIQGRKIREKKTQERKILLACLRIPCIRKG